MSVIGHGITIVGEIDSAEDLQVLGKINGDVRCPTLILHEESALQGTISADCVRILGTFNGSIRTKDLAIEASARIAGDVIYSRLHLASGAILQGQLKHRPAARDLPDARRRIILESDLP